MEASGGVPGGVTRISLTFERVGSEKSTSFSRSGVIVRFPATMSTLPSTRAGSSLSRDIGT